MSKISFKKVLAAVVLLGMVAGTAFVLGSCGKRTADGSAETAKECSVTHQGESLLETMTRIYANIYGDTVAFASAEMVEQDNGYTIAVASAEKDGEYINFAVLAEQVGDTVTVSDNPRTSCECIGHCEGGCKAYLLNGLVWDCTPCPDSKDDAPCSKNEGGTIPGGGTPQN